MTTNVPTKIQLTLCPLASFDTFATKSCAVLWPWRSAFWLSRCSVHQSSRSPPLRRTEET